MLVGNMVARRNRQELHRSTLKRVVQNFSIEVGVWLILEFLLDLFCKLDRILVGKRESESEVGLSRIRIRKHMAELECKLIIRIEIGLSFSHDSAPLLLMVWLNAIDGLQALIVKFCLLHKLKYCSLKTIKIDVTDKHRKSLRSFCLKLT